jgi:hypothetical protein
MAEAIEHLRSGLVVGHVKPGCRNQQRGSVAQRVPDGDTVIIEGQDGLGIPHRRRRPVHLSRRRAHGRLVLQFMRRTVPERQGRDP